MNEVQIDFIIRRLAKIEKELAENGRDLDKLLLERRQPLFRKIINHLFNEEKTRLKKSEAYKKTKAYKESIEKTERPNVKRINLAEVLGFVPMAAQVMYPGDYPEQNKVKDK